jgi:histidyl-tRNA synthetase
MAVQQYIFNVWASTAESFGFEQYDASVLEPAALYQAKGAANEELLNEQTYTFTDRGDRVVTLRPEMTPTVARMIAAKWRELAGTAPVRWYAIPNLFRYERTQRGRLREHWQLNCDTFGSSDISADIEMIALAYQVFKNFGATDDQFTIQVNDRQLMERLYRALGLLPEQMTALYRLNDKREKISATAYRTELDTITGDHTLSEEIILLLDHSDEQTDVMIGLAELGITNVVFNKSLARGFDYYTGTIFEFKDNHPNNNRSLLGGGRYDNLTELFGSAPVTGVGFGLGDVTMRDFLTSHNLLPDNLRSCAEVVVIPVTIEQNLSALRTAHTIRELGKDVVTDYSAKRVGEKIGRASLRGAQVAVIVGEDEVTSQKFTAKFLATGEEQSGSLSDLFS